MCRARVPAPVPRIILWRGRFATISSISGITALRPRSIMLWPPILTTFAQGRIAKSGVCSVARCNVRSLSDSVTSRLPRSVSIELSPFIPRYPLAPLSLGEPEHPHLEPVSLKKNRVERTELGLRPGAERAQGVLAGRPRQLRKTRAARVTLQKGPRAALDGPACDDLLGRARCGRGEIGGGLLAPAASPRLRHPLRHPLMEQLVEPLLQTLVNAVLRCRRAADDHRAAGLQHPARLVDKRARIGKIAEHRDQQHRVKAGGGKRQGAAIRLDEARALAVARPVGEDSQHPSGKIGSDIVVAGHDERPAEAAGARAYIENAGPIDIRDSLQHGSADRLRHPTR